MSVEAGSPSRQQKLSQQRQKKLDAQVDENLRIGSLDEATLDDIQARILRTDLLEVVRPQPSPTQLLSHGCV